MKKMIVATALLLAVIGAGIFETVTAWRYFTQTGDRLDVVMTELSTREEDEVSDFAASELTAIIEDWQGREDLFYIIYDNRALSDFYERSSTAKRYVLRGNNTDALAELECALFRVRSLARDALPLPLNFL